MNTNIRSILALTDFSAEAGHALQRAASIAADHGAALTLVYLNEASGDRLADRLVRLAQLGRQLHRRHGISVRAAQTAATTLADLVRRTRDADLLVLEPLSGHRFSGMWPSPALPGLLARSECPLLIVRNGPERAYGQSILAIDPAVDPHALVRYASDFETDSTLDIYRIEKRRTSATVPRQRIPRSLVANSFREGRRSGRQQAFRLTDHLDNRHGRLLARTGRIDAVAQILNEQAFTGADLVIVARHRPTLVEGLLQRDFAQRLVRNLRCDLLVVPDDYPAHRPRQEASGLAMAM